MELDIVGAVARTIQSNKKEKSLNGIVQRASKILIERNARMYSGIFENKIASATERGEYEIRCPVFKQEFSISWDSVSRRGEPTLSSVGVTFDDMHALFQNETIRDRMWDDLFERTINILRYEYASRGFVTDFKDDHFLIRWGNQ